MIFFQYGFMLRAFLAAIAISVIAPLLGVFLVIRRQSLMADTLSHVSLAGVALGLFWQIDPSITTFLVVVISAIILEYLRQLYLTYSEVSTAILMSGGLAFALFLMNLGKGTSALSIQQYLFGSIITIDWFQVGVLLALLIALLIIFFLFRKPMYVMIFDEATAFVDGLPVRQMSIAFNILTGIVVSLMIPMTGALLVSAIIVLPAAIGMRIGGSFISVILCSIAVGLIGMVSGLYSSFSLGTPSGAGITLIFIFIFLLVNFLQELRRIIKKKTIVKEKK